MAIKAEARVAIKGASEAIRSLQGVARATTQQRKEEAAATRAAVQGHKEALAALKQRMSSSASLLKQRTQAEQAAARAKERAEQQASRAAEREARVIERTNQQLADRNARAARHAADARIKEEARVTQAAKREAAERARALIETAATAAKKQREAFQKAGGLLGTGAAAALAGAVTANSTARGIAGVKSSSERITEGNSFVMRLTGTSAAAGLSREEQAGVQKNILAATTKNGSDAGDVLGALEQAQALFDDVETFSGKIVDIDTIATAAQASTQDLTVALGQMKAQFGLTADDMMDAAYRMKASGDIGAVELKGFASAFSGSVGIFAANTGLRGNEGVQQFIALSQVAKTGGFDDAQTSTQVERFSADLQDKDVRKGLRGIGIKESAYSDDGGKTVDVGRFLDALANNKKFQDQGTRQKIFPEQLSLRLINTALQRREDMENGTGKFDFDSMMERSSVESGRASVAESYQRLSEQEPFAMAQEAAKMQAETIENLKGYNEQILSVVKAGDDLERKFGSLAVWAGAISATGVTGVALNLLSGGKSGGLLGGALQGGSKLIGAARASPWVAGLLGALTIGNKATGWLRDDNKTGVDLISDWWNGGESTPGAVAAPTGSSNAPETESKAFMDFAQNFGGDAMVKAIRETASAQTAELKQINSGLRANLEKPSQSGKREPD